MQQAAEALVNQLLETVEEHGAVFRKSCADVTESHPKLLKISDEENVEPPFPNLVMGYKIDSVLEKSGVMTDYTISVSGPDHEAMFLEILRVVAAVQHERSNCVFSYNWREKDEHHYITGEVASK